MRKATISGASIGALTLLLSTSAWAQSGQPVQVVPITPVNPSSTTSKPAPAPVQTRSNTPNQGPAAPATAVTQPATIVPYTPAPQSSPAVNSTIASSNARKLDLSFKNGKVNLVAENVTVTEILAEWTKRGGTVIDNAEKLTGGIVGPFAFENEPELNVIQALLRPYAGMIVVPKPASSTIASSFSRVNVVPHGTASATAFVGMPTAQPQYQNQNPDDELPPVMAPGQMPAARVPQPPAQNPQPATGPLGQPLAGPGAARPGNAVVAPVSTPVPGQIIK